MSDITREEMVDYIDRLIAEYSTKTNLPQNIRTNLITHLEKEKEVYEEYARSKQTTFSYNEEVSDEAKEETRNDTMLFLESMINDRNSIIYKRKYERRKVKKTNYGINASKHYYCYRDYYKVVKYRVELRTKYSNRKVKQIINHIWQMSS